MSGSSEPSSHRAIFEKAAFDRAVRAFDRGNLAEAQKEFRRVVALDGRLRADAEKYLTEIETRLRPAAKKGDDLPRRSGFDADLSIEGTKPEPSGFDIDVPDGFEPEPPGLDLDPLAHEPLPEIALPETKRFGVAETGAEAPLEETVRRRKRPAKRPTLEVAKPLLEAVAEEAPPPGAGGTPAAPEPLRRTPHLDVDPPAPAAPGDELTVAVYADTQGFATGESGETIELPGGGATYDLQVWLVVAEQLEIVGPSAKPLRISRDEKRSAAATFTVRVRPDIASGKGAAITALFAYDGRACGRVSRQIAVTVAGEAARHDDDVETTAARPSKPLPPSTLRIEAGAVPADLSVRIVAVPGGDGRLFECRVTTPHLPAYDDAAAETWRLADSAAALVSTYMARFVAPNMTNLTRTLALEGAGIRLFKAAPALFQKVFWELVDAGKPPRTLSIVSEEPYIPWELMVPHRPGENGASEEREALGVELSVGRWTANDLVHPPQRIAARDGYVIAPRDSKLAAAEDEATLVLGAFPPGQRIDPAAVASLLTAFGQQPRSLVHFICHGKSGDNQVLVLENKEELDVTYLPAMKGLAKAFRADRPLVFLNACEVGRTAPELVGVGGFAEEFMALGASAVVAPLWSVKDSIAHEVAVTFYQRMKAEPATPLAEILRDLRKRSYAEAGGEDTYAAYCFYGDPLATCVPAET